MDEGFRSLTAKEIRKQNERHSEEKRREKRRRSDDGGGVGDKNESDDAIRKKRYEDERLLDRKHSRERGERSGERYSGSRQRDDRRSDRGRGDDYGIWERSSGLGHSRDRSPERRSSRDGEDRADQRDHHCKQRNDRRVYDGNKDSRRSHSARHHGSEETEEGSSDRPAWATKAVMKRAEEIQKRKLIWSKKEEKKETDSSSATSPTGPRPSTTATWNSILAASSSDSKQLDKFKRLMGMKKSDEEGQEEAPKVDDSQVEAERKRQRELYSHLDQQYAEARSFTHLSRERISCCPDPRGSSPPQPRLAGLLDHEI